MDLPIRDSVSSATGKTYVQDFYPIDCALGYSPYGFPNSVREFLHDEGTDIDLSQYHSFDNLLGLIIGIAKSLESTGISREQIFLSHGSIDALSLLFFRLLKPKGMLGIGPQFAHAIKLFLLTGGYYNPIPLNLHDPENLFPLEKIKEEIRNNKEKYSMVYLDNPNNPLGFHLPLQKVQEIVELAEKSRLFVIIDEAYGDFLPYKESAVNLVNNYKNLIVVRSFSKGWGLASIRCGYFIVHPTLCSSARKISDPFVPSYLSAKIAAAALKEKEFLPQVVKKVEHDKFLLKEIFRKSQFEVLPSHPKIPIFSIYYEGVDVAEVLAQLGISVESGKYFSSTRKDFTPEFARVRVVHRKEDIEHLAYRMENAFKKYCRKERAEV